MQMMRARCKPCGWIYDVVAIPMEMGKAAKTMQERAACPMCGDRHALMADPRPLTPQEIEHKLPLVPASMKPKEPAE